MKTPVATGPIATGSTRERLVEVAERLFAERGIAAVSLREVGTAAGQRNNSAVLYHFGSKQELIRTIFAKRMGPINERRLAMLEALDRSGRRDDLRALLEVLVYPLAESVSAHSHYLRFLAQVLASPARLDLIGMELDVMEGLRRVGAQLDRSLENLAAPLRQLRHHRLITASNLAVTVLAQHERELHERSAQAMPTAALLGNLLDMMVGMLTAPASAAARRELKKAGRRSA